MTLADCIILIWSFWFSRSQIPFIDLAFQSYLMKVILETCRAHSSDIYLVHWQIASTSQDKRHVSSKCQQKCCNIRSCYRSVTTTRRFHQFALTNHWCVCQQPSTPYSRVSHCGWTVTIITSYCWKNKNIENKRCCVDFFYIMVVFLQSSSLYLFINKCRPTNSSNINHSFNILFQEKIRTIFIKI